MSMTHTMMVDTDISKFALRNKLWRELHMYVVLRDICKDSSGYWVRKYAASWYASGYGCSIATAYKRLDKLVSLGWVSEHGRMIHVTGILRVKALLAGFGEEFHYSRYMTESLVRVQGNYRRVVDSFRISIIEGLKLEKVQRNLHRSRLRFSNSYLKDKVRGASGHIASGKCKIGKRLVEARYDRSYAMHLVSHDLGIGLSSVHRYKRKAEALGLSKYEVRYKEGMVLSSYYEVTKALVLGSDFNPGRFKKIGQKFFAKDADRITFGFAFGKRKGKADGRRSNLSCVLFGSAKVLSCVPFFLAPDFDKIGCA